MKDNSITFSKYQMFSKITDYPTNISWLHKLSLKPEIIGYSYIIHLSKSQWDSDSDSHEIQCMLLKDVFRTNIPVSHPNYFLKKSSDDIMPCINNLVAGPLIWYIMHFTINKAKYISLSGLRRHRNIMGCRGYFIHVYDHDGHMWVDDVVGCQNL